MSGNDRQIAVEFISAMGIPPVEFVELVAKLECRYLGIALEPISRYEGYPLWSLRTDPKLRRDTIAAMRHFDVSVSLGEGFLAWPDKDIRATAPDMDLLCELGAPCVNLVSLDNDKARAFDQCAAFADMASTRGLTATVEFMPGMLIGNLAVATEVVRHVGRKNFGMLVDAMHFFRSGSDLAQLAKLERSAIGYVQLCDVPKTGQGSYGDEARFERRCPGEGELPLREFLRALPTDALIGLEVPMLLAANAGIGPLERLRPCIAATRGLLS
jgi:sugar phosphate isomerase/epimerase